jgi:hypothetical protein
MTYHLPERIPERITIQRASERSQNLNELKKIATISDPHPYLIILEDRKWRTGRTLTVAFNGGTPERHAEIAHLASEWSSFANLHFDFGRDAATGGFRSWSSDDTTYKADVRVSFNNPNAYWSVTGTESLDPDTAAPGQPSMNLGDMDKEDSPMDWEGHVRHEFGHAIGLVHEHQSPFHVCDWRWNDDVGYVKTLNKYNEYGIDEKGLYPGLYTWAGGPPQYWPPEKTDFNFKQLPNSSAYGFGDFDKLSIMKYNFDAWIFENGDQSDCYSPPGENNNFSEEDKARIAIFYPKAPDVADAQNHEKLTAISRLLPQLSASPSLIRQFQVQQRQLQTE